MDGFGCPWCDQEVSVGPQAWAAGSIVCPACRTQVDLAVGTSSAPGDGDLPDVELPLAA